MRNEYNPTRRTDVATQPIRTLSRMYEAAGRFLREETGAHPVESILESPLGAAVREEIAACSTPEARRKFGNIIRIAGAAYVTFCV